MLFNSPGRKVRMGWTKVNLPENNIDNILTDTRELRNWCIENSSEKQFFIHYIGHSFWFEDPSDALLFKLRWG